MQHLIQHSIALYSLLSCYYCTLTLVEAVKAFVDAPAMYQNAPSFAYVIGDYTVSKTGTVFVPANEALMAALNAKGFIAE